MIIARYVVPGSGYFLAVLSALKTLFIIQPRTLSWARLKRPFRTYNLYIVILRHPLIYRLPVLPVLLNLVLYRAGCFHKSNRIPIR